MKSRQQIESELSEKRQLIEESDSAEFEGRLRQYIEALEWVLDGSADQIGAVRVGEWQDFEAAVLAARTNDGKLFLSEEVDQDGVYALLRFDRDSGK